MNLRGVFPPITTPFDQDEVDLRALRSNVDRLMTTEVTGLVALGSNGEAPQLDEDEADRVVATVRDHVPRDRTLIVGTGRESTRAAIAASRRAADLGADAVLVRTPSFFKSQMTPEAFVRHYTAVADACPVPVLLYNFTAVTGVNLAPDTVTRLSEHPNIVGVKDSSGDVDQVGELVARTPDGFAVLAGAAQTMYASLCVGATGVVLALACVVPDLCVRLYRLVRERQHEEALQLQRQLAPLGRAVTSRFGVPGLKAALDLVGYIGGDPRPPLGPAPPAAIEQIRQELVALQAVPTA